MLRNYLEKRGSLRRFFSILAKARLPYLAILSYILFSGLITNVVLDTTEYSAKLFAGEVGFVAVVLPFVLSSLLSLLLGSLSGILSDICTALIDKNMRLMVWKKLVRLPLSFYTKGNTRELISRVTTDTSSISSLIMNVFVLTLTSLYTVAATFGRIAAYDTRLVLCMFLVVPVNVTLSLIMGRVRFGTGDRLTKSNAEFTQVVSEDMSNIQLVKTAGQEEYEYQRGMAMAKRLYKSTIANMWMSSLSSPLYAVTQCMQFILLVLVGRSFYSSGAITLPQWIAFYTFSGNIIGEISSYCGNWVTLKASQGATNRVSQIMAQPEEEQNVGKPVSDVQGDITFSHVDFAYGDTSIFQDLNLKIRAGRTTAIIGSSGSGKTTILNLIERFYPLTGGQICFGEDSIADWKLGEYRQRLGYVTQESIVLQGTLRENLTMGLNREIGEEELTDVCRKVGLGDLLEETSEGLDLPISPLGGSLSGGQRQRLCIARALLDKPEYLLLDEVTSAIDISGRDELLKTLQKEMLGKTLIMVTHDYQTILQAEDLIVIENGKLLACGPTKELLREERIQRLLGKEESI